MRLASLVYGANPSQRRVRALINGGRASSSVRSTLVDAPTVTGQPARATVTSPVSVFVRPGDGSMTVAPRDPHFVGAHFSITSCSCICHFGGDACEPLPGSLASYADCSIVRR